MFMGFTDTQDNNNHESLENKGKNGGLDPARAEAANMWQSSMEAAPTFDPTSNENTPDNSIDNPNDEQLRTPKNATENAADDIIAAGTIDNGDIGGQLAQKTGSGDTVIKDANEAGSNVAQAVRAADSIPQSVANGGSGEKAGLDILNGAMVETGAADKLTRKAVAESAIEHPNAEIDKAAAEEAITRAEEVLTSLKAAAPSVQTQEVAQKMDLGATVIADELANDRRAIEQAASEIEAAKGNPSNEPDNMTLAKAGPNSNQPETSPSIAETASFGQSINPSDENISRPHAA